jgi:alkaline phosphatase D
MRTAAYQAWFEHMPVRIPSFEDPAFMKIYRTFDFGDLARMVVLDTRQYRDPQPCDDEIGLACAEIYEGGRTLLGDEQLTWLHGELVESPGHWNLIAQQVLFSPVLMEVGIANPDQWDGYLDDRQAVLDLMADPGVTNPMVLSGDVHAAGFAELYADQHDRESPRVALEVLTTSISSGGDDIDELATAGEALIDASPRAHYFDGQHRGFALLDLTRDQCQVTYYAVTTVREPQADLTIAARFRVHAGDLSFERRI